MTPEDFPFPYRQVILGALYFGLIVVLCAGLAGHFVASLLNIQIDQWIWLKQDMFLVYIIALLWGALYSFVGLSYDWAVTVIDYFENEQERKRNPRPRFYQSVEARATGLTLRRGNDVLTPLSSAHYAIIYKRLARKRNIRQWKITRNDLDVKHGGVPAFENLTAKYKKIMKHWAWLGWIDGYVTGDTKKETYYLNEQGQAAFIRNGRLSVNGSASPIE